MTVKVMTMVAQMWSDVQPGDLVQLERLPHLGAVGYVFDIVGDVVRVWDPQARESDVDGLMPFQRSELALVHRPDAFLSVRYTGTRSDGPYVFVCADSRARVLNAERIFTNAGDYVIVEKRLERVTELNEDVEDGGHDEDEPNADTVAE